MAVIKFKDCVTEGSFYQFGLGTMVTINTIGVYEIIPDMTLTFSEHLTFQNTQEFKIEKPGWYDVNWDTSCDSAANVEICGSIFKNGVMLVQLQSNKKLSNAFDIAHFSAHQHALFAKDDIVSMAVANNTSTADIEVTSAHLDIRFMKCA